MILCSKASLVKDFLRSVQRHDPGSLSLVEQIIRRTTHDQRDRSERRSEPAPAMLPVNFRSRPANVGDDEKPPNNSNRIDRQAITPQRERRELSGAGSIFGKTTRANREAG